MNQDLSILAAQQPSSPVQPMVQNQAVAAFFLIENSQTMTMLWPDLQDRYLPNVMARFEAANPVSPTTIFILESLPAYSSRFMATPRQYDNLKSGLCDITLNREPSNRLSADKISNAIEFLAATELRHQLVVRHLVIVAASTPIDDIAPVNYSVDYLWCQLAQKLAQAEIQCHMVLNPIQNMSPLMTLFEETLRLQNLIEEPPSFPIDPQRFLFRLSSRPAGLYSDAASYVTPSPQSMLPRRNQSFPLSSSTFNSDHMLAISPLNDPENPPSLVSHLQQVHGLTKKKVYGAKPVRKPFVRDERVHRDVPGVAPLTLSVQKTFPQPGVAGRAVSSSKAARINRVAQNSPPDIQSRRPISRPNSLMASADGDSLPSPTTYSTIPDVSSPISPAYQLPNIYPQPLAVPMQVENIPDASWEDATYTSLPPNLNHSPLLPYTNSVSSQTLANPWQANEVDMQLAEEANSATLSYTPGVLLTPDQGTKTRVANSAPHKKRRASCAEDEEPFTFNAEYVAATAVLFKAEVLPAYPDLQPAYANVVSPRRAFYIAQDQGSAPSSPSSAYDPGELYTAAEREKKNQVTFSQSLEYPPPLAGSPCLSYPNSYSPGSSSSLNGWAG